MWNLLMLLVVLFTDTFGALLKTLASWLGAGILALLVLVPLTGCKSVGPGWILEVNTGGFSVEYKNLEAIAGRTYENVQTFDTEGLNLLTANIQQLKTDPNRELTDEQQAYVDGLEATIAAREGEVAALEAELAGVQGQSEAPATSPGEKTGAPAPDD